MKVKVITNIKDSGTGDLIQNGTMYNCDLDEMPEGVQWAVKNNRKDIILVISDSNSKSKVIRPMKEKEKGVVTGPITSVVSNLGGVDQDNVPDRIAKPIEVTAIEPIPVVDLKVDEKKIKRMIKKSGK